MKPAQHGAGDNNAGIRPQAWSILTEVNQAHASAYGDDSWTKQAVERIGRLVEADCEAVLVFNGTAGNGLALASLGRRRDAVICRRPAQVEAIATGQDGR